MDDALLEKITHILNAAGFKINEKKTHFQRRGHHQVVTGLSVADGLQPRIPRHFKRSLRKNIYFTAQFGLAAQAELLDMDPEALSARISGQINYVLGVERSLGKKLLSDWQTALQSI